MRYKYTLSYRSILKVAGGQHGAVHEVIPSRQIFILFYGVVYFKFLTESGDVSFLTHLFIIFWFWSEDRPLFASITRLITALPLTNHTSSSSLSLSYIQPTTSGWKILFAQPGRKSIQALHILISLYKGHIQPSGSNPALHSTYGRWSKPLAQFPTILPLLAHCKNQVAFTDLYSRSL